MVSNEEYEAALNNLDNIHIMEKACWQFRFALNQDDIKECKLIALWDSLRCWKPGGKKFTSFLYQKLRWQCLKAINKKKKQKFDHIVIEPFSKNDNAEFIEWMDELSEELQDIFEKRFIYKMTLREIGEEYDCCHETIRKKINQALKTLKSKVF